MSSAAERREARAKWPGRVETLSTARDGALVSQGTAAERLAMTWRLSRETWLLSGGEMPAYARPEMPGRVLRSSDD